MEIQKKNSFQSDHIEKTRRILKKGDAKIKSYDHPIAVLILGNPDVGNNMITEVMINFVAKLPERNSNLRDLFSLEVTMDQTSNTVYYDIPCFNDARDPFKEITSTYFIEQVIDRSQALKLVFTINHSSIQQEEPTDFINLIQQASKLIKNIDLFTNSIALVVTNVNDVYSNDTSNTLLPDNVILKEIINILVNTKTTMSHDENAVKLIDIFLTKDQENYSKLSVLRCTSGTKNKVDILREEKLNLKSMIGDRLMYALFVKEDFRFELSPKCRLGINEIFVGNNAALASALESFLLIIQNHCKEEQKMSHDLDKLYIILDNISNEVRTTLNIFQTTEMKPKELRKELEALFFKLDIPLDQGDLKITMTYYRNRGFLRTLLPNDLNFQSSGWISPLKNLHNRLNEYLNWCSFLSITQNRLLEYEIQNDKHRYNAEKFEELLSEIRTASQTPITGENLQYFFETLFDRNNDDILGYNRVKNSIIDDTQWEMLRKVIVSFFMKDATYSCIPESKELIIKGKALQIRRIRWDKECEGVRSVKIFAKNVIFIDSDIDEAIRGRHFTIIAPTWEIIGDRKIILNGTEFFGLGYTFRNGTNLFIDSKGDSMKNLIELHWKSRIKFNGPFIRQRDFLRRQVGALNEYKMYEMKQSRQGTDMGFTIRMNQEIYNNEKILRLYDVEGFVNEILNLESHFELNLETNPVQAYQSLLKSIKEYYKNMKSRIPSSHVNALQFAYTLCTSKIWALKYDVSNHLIINIEKHLNQVMKRLNKLKDNEKLLLVRILVHNSKNKREFEIKELLKLMNDQISPYIRDAERDINKNIEYLLSEINKLKSDRRDNIKRMKNLEKEIKGVFMRKIMLQALAGIGTVVSCLGPIGLMVGSLTVGGAEIGQNFISQPDDSLIANVGVIPKGVTEALKTMEEYSKQRDDKNLKILEEQIKILNSTSDPDLDKVIGKLLKIKGESNRKIEYKQVQEVLKQAETDFGILKKTKTIAVVTKARLLAPFMSSIGDFHSSTIQYRNSMDMLIAALKNNKQQIKQLDILTPVINNILAAGFEATTTFVNDVKNKMGKGVRVPEVERWALQKKISEIKQHMQKFTSGFSVNTEMMDCWEKMDDALNQLNNAYDKIQNLEKDKQLYDLIASVGSINTGSSMYADGQLKINIMEMIVSIQYNAIWGKYKRILRALEQTAFPFADYYFWAEESIVKSKSLPSMIGSITAKIDEIKSTLTESKNSIIGQNHHIHAAHFSSRNDKKRPFYIWKNEEHRYLIGKLLAGEEISLVADVTKVRLHSAVKFDKIELYFNSNNETVQRRIDSILLSKQILMTHSGVSHYRCGNQVYTFVSSPQYLDHSYAKSDISKMDPIDTTETHKKLMKAQPILSPYTTWKVKLEDVGNDLLKYKDYVDLELAGHGSYVKNDNEICYNKNIYQYTIDRELSEKLYMQAIETNDEENSSNSRYRRMVKPFVHGIPPIFNPTQSTSVFAKNCIENFNKTDTTTQNHTRFDNYDGSCMLLELCIRKCTGEGQKSRNTNQDESDVTDLVLDSINIVCQFEKDLGKLARKYQVALGRMNLDLYDLIDQFKSNWLKGLYKDSYYVLYNRVALEESEPNAAEFNKDLVILIKNLLGYNGKRDLK